MKPTLILTLTYIVLLVLYVLCIVLYLSCTIFYSDEGSDTWLPKRQYFCTMKILWSEFWDTFYSTYRTSDYDELSQQSETNYHNQNLQKNYYAWLFMYFVYVLC